MNNIIPVSAARDCDAAPRHCAAQASPPLRSSGTALTSSFLVLTAAAAAVVVKPLLSSHLLVSLQLAAVLAAVPAQVVLVGHAPTAMLPVLLGAPAHAMCHGWQPNAPACAQAVAAAAAGVLVGLLVVCLAVLTALQPAPHGALALAACQVLPQPAPACLARQRVGEQQSY